jgi:hypothetical protein
MHNLTRKHELILFAGLLSFLFFTRGSHFASIISLPDASVAIFFIVGFYLRNPIFFIFAITQSMLIDYLVTSSLGTAESCFTSAYIFLLFAYTSVWISGRWLSKHWQPNLLGVMNFFKAALLGIIVGEIISSGSYNLINQTQPNGFDMVELLVQYLPHALKITLTYLLVAASIHSIFLSYFSKKSLDTQVK